MSWVFGFRLVLIIFFALFSEECLAKDLLKSTTLPVQRHSLGLFPISNTTHNGHCYIEDKGMKPWRENIIIGDTEDYHEARIIKVFNMINATMKHPYLDVRYYKTNLVIFIKDDFKEYEEKEALNVTVGVVNIKCTKGTAILKVKLIVLDTNNHDPKFLSDLYDYELVPPIKAGTVISGDVPVLAKDVDLRNKKIYFGIDHNPFFSIKYNGRMGLKTHRASIVAKQDILDIHDPVTFNIHATDEEKTRRGQAQVNVIFTKSLPAVPEYIEKITRKMLSPDLIFSDTIKSFKVDNITYEITSDYVDFFTINMQNNGSVKLTLNQPIEGVPNSTLRLTLTLKSSTLSPDDPDQSVIIDLPNIASQVAAPKFNYSVQYVDIKENEIAPKVVSLNPSESTLEILHQDLENGEAKFNIIGNSLYIGPFDKELWNHTKPKALLVANYKGITTKLSYGRNYIAGGWKDAWPSVQYNNYRTLIVVNIQDVNDNSPYIFGVPISVGFPASHLLSQIPPRFIFEFMIHDEDFDKNTFTIETSSKNFFIKDMVEHVSGAKFFVAASDSIDRDENITMTLWDGANKVNETIEVLIINEDYLLMMDTTLLNHRIFGPSGLLISESNFTLGYFSVKNMHVKTDHTYLERYVIYGIHDRKPMERDHLKRAVLMYYTRNDKETDAMSFNDYMNECPAG